MLVNSDRWPGVLEFDLTFGLAASDQGVVISVNGGQTWSSGDNQPTAQLYHIITDNRFP